MAIGKGAAVAVVLVAPIVEETSTMGVLIMSGRREIVLPLFLIDFVTISIATDNSRPSAKPETWGIGALDMVAVSLGFFMVMESFGMLYIAMNYLGLTDATGLRTFTFCMLIFGGMFTIFVVRERGHFWKSVPSRTLLLAIGGDMLVTAAIAIIGIPGLIPIPAAYVLMAWAWYFAFALLVNDFIKVRLLPRLGAIKM